MPFKTPNLDDRSFEELVRLAKSTAARSCPEWTDQSAGDPMTALLEASAFLTDMLIYRVNRMPDKAYAAFLNLIGAQVAPPSAAVTTIEFTRKPDAKGVIEFPAGTRIKAGGTDVSFVLREAVQLAAETDSATAEALHAEVVEGELLGVSDGVPGQTFTLQHAPVIADTGDGLDIVIGVEEPLDELVDSPRSLEFNGKSFRVWELVEAFSWPDADAYHYVCDRYEGRVTFAPSVQGGNDQRRPGRASLARTPPAGREIRAWYRTGGGAAGNVAAHALDTLDGANPGVEADNPERAVGGRDAESLQSALERGPHSLRALDTVVTAKDFERVALSTRGAARARAFARSQLWAHADPGTVEVQIVPYVDEKLPAEQRSLASTVAASQTDELLKRTLRVVSTRAPLGVKTLIGWTRIRSISLQLKAVCFREENPDTVRSRLVERVHAAISPFANRDFGQPLRASDIHELVEREPGIRYVEKLRFRVDETPQHKCTRIRADAFQPRSWYAVSGDSVYRTLDDGESWCEVLALGDADTPLLCQPHSLRPGWLAAISVRQDDTSAIHLSRDGGESWQRDAAVLAFKINDIAWSTNKDETLLFLATSKGLYTYDPLSTDAPKRIVVIEGDDQHGFWAVATAPAIYGATTVAVAAGQRKGIWTSTSGAQSHQFRLSGLQEKDVRVLQAQLYGGRAFLWAGFAAEAGDDGEGCSRLELRGHEDDPAGWQAVQDGWKGGSCESIAFSGERVFAATNRAGILQLPAADKNDGWLAGQINNGLPIRDEQRLLHVVNDIAVRGNAGTPELLMAGGEQGVFRSRDGAATFQDAARTSFEDFVALPEGWLFASGNHEIEVVSEDAGE